VVPAGFEQNLLAAGFVVRRWVAPVPPPEIVQFALVATLLVMVLCCIVLYNWDKRRQWRSTRTVPCIDGPPQPRAPNGEKALDILVNGACAVEGMVIFALAVYLTGQY